MAEQALHDQILNAGNVVREFVPLSSLVWDQRLYPRQTVSRLHVEELMEVIQGDHKLPPIVCCRTTRKIIDGIHRWKAHQEYGKTEIFVEWRDYPDDEARFCDGVFLNRKHGLGFSAKDRLRVVKLGEREFGLKDVGLANMLSVSPAYVRTLMPRYAAIADDPKRGKPAERRKLSGTQRHLNGQTLTQEQGEALKDAPDASYLLLVRQLISAAEHGLLPPEDQHPVLWNDLRRLAALLGEVGVTTAG